MKIILEVTFPHEPFNALVRAGSIDTKMAEILESLKPEAVYFTDNDGKRSAIIITDLSDASKIPTLAEPFFLTFNADIRIRVAMTGEDLQKSGLKTLGQKWA